MSRWWRRACAIVAETSLGSMQRTIARGRSTTILLRNLSSYRAIGGVHAAA